MTPQLRLRNLNILAKLGVTCLLLTLLGGYVVASLAHMREHHQNRDGKLGLTAKDIQGVYHGIDDPPLMLTILSEGHAPNMPDEEREILLRWLESSNIAANYENVDFDAFTPEEVIDMNCLECHGRDEARDNGAGITLTSFDDVKKFAFPVVVNPVDEKILLMSTHAHASTMAVVGLMVSLLLVLTGFNRWLCGLLIAMIGAGLLLDMGAMWLARENVFFTNLVIFGGGAHSAATTISVVLTILGLWMPAKRNLSTE